MVHLDESNDEEYSETQRKYFEMQLVDHAELHLFSSLRHPSHFLNKIWRHKQIYLSKYTSSCEASPVGLIHTFLAVQAELQLSRVWSELRLSWISAKAQTTCFDSNINLYLHAVIWSTCLCQVLALELIKILLENSGPVFRHSDRFVAAIKQYLCLSLLKNVTSSYQQAQTLTCSLFYTLLSKFRHSLKAEIGVFFPMILLRAVEPVASASTNTNGMPTYTRESIWRHKYYAYFLVLLKWKNFSKEGRF